ncbi:protein kinase [Nonomuraea sp. NPDC049419]|uniref:protein kinase domain-containing protein n=1 Tax=Nonomuraea sp. NPDC049419 TaxID=3155772 RepID=UPI0034246319
MTPPTDRVPGPPRRVHGSRPPGPARQAGDVQPPAPAQQARGPHPPGPAHEARGPHLFRSAERVRGYHLVGPAGQDGPWTLYRARSVATMADVLVKTLACHRVGKRALKRIIRGFAFPGELAAHPGVIPVLEVGATGDGRPYLVTPPHDGLTLAERPDRDRPMPIEQVAGLLAAVARAVAATHAAGGVHGRVTPSNVVMTPNGVMLTGFAMSALMSIAELPDGTPPSVHASPEELEGRPPSPASDVYTLASTTYELLTGHPAFPLEDATNTARFTLAVLTEPPPPLPPTVPEPLATLLAQALSKDPATRPTATTLAATAHRFASGPPRPHITGAPAAGKGATAPDVQQAAPAGSAADQRFGVDGSGPSSVAPPPFGGTAASSAGPTSGSVPGAAADQPRTARLPEPGPVPEPGPRLPRTARLPASGSPGNQELSGPRELVWTVDSERSRVRPPAGPQPFLPTPPEPGSSAQAPDGQAPAAQAPAAAEGGRRGRTPLVVAGVSALAVLAGAGSVALAMSGDRGATQTADHQAAATQPPDTGVRDGQPGEGDTQNSPHDGQPQDGQVQDGRPQPLRPDARATGDRSQPEPSPAPEQSTAGPATSPPATLRTPGPATLTAYRPKSLKLVADNGTTVTLSWKTARRTEYPVIVQQAPDDRLMSAPVGSTTYTVGKLDPGTGYCFKVGAVVALGRPSSVAWSSALCIRGAAETGAEDDVQPPIVLPLVTPPTG